MHEEPTLFTLEYNGVPECKNRHILEDLGRKANWRRKEEKDASCIKELVFNWRRKKEGRRKQINGKCKLIPNGWHMGWCHK